MLASWGVAMKPAPVRVLIVEDDPDSARMLRVLLKRSGYETQVEHDGLNALRTAREFRPRFILLDQTLEGMSGVEVANQLRAIPEIAGCTILAVSGHSKESLSPPSPSDGHFQKPIDPQASLDSLSKTRD